MALLIDPPMWPAHGTLWSHLVSDTDHDELHAFARKMRLPRRGFDLDHYDVPAALHASAVELGAIPVEAKELTRRLRAAGLRVRQVERGVMTPVRRREYLDAEWARLGAALGVAGAALSTGIAASDTEPAGAAPATWAELGAQLLARWNEPHRRYHDERHLEDVLLALDQLEVRGEVIEPVTLLAAWFHDAVYAGAQAADHDKAEAGSGTDNDTGIESDEAASARLAARELSRFALADNLVAQVAELIEATEPGREVTAPAPPLAQLLDADLAIFAAPPHRYDEYAAAVREEYAAVPDAAFTAARASILEAYLDRPEIYFTDIARTLWTDRARANLSREIAALRAS